MGIIVKPLVTEKMTAITEKLNRFGFVVRPEANKNVFLSARNIERANVAIASALNTYSVLNAQTLVVTENSLKVIENILS